jgi:hypothetical protein
MKHLGSRQWGARVHGKERNTRMPAIDFGKHNSIYRIINPKYTIVALPASSCP